MKKFAYTLVTSMGATSGQVEVPAGREQTLTLRETLIIADDGPSYHRNLHLALRPDGSLVVIDAADKGLPALQGT